jgi:hypothetical protein
MIDMLLIRGDFFIISAQQNSTVPIVGPWSAAAASAATTAQNLLGTAEEGIQTAAGGLQNLAQVLALNGDGQQKSEHKKLEQ